MVRDTVFAENFTGTCVITGVTGLLSYVVKLSDGVTVRRHVNSICRQDFSTNYFALPTQPPAQALMPPPPIPPGDVHQAPPLPVIQMLIRY